MIDKDSISSQMDAYILTGGESKRFGTNKANHKIDNVSFLDRIYSELEKSFRNVYLIGKHNDDPNKTHINDFSPEQSPLVGLITALEHTCDEWIFVISVDMPFITSKIVEKICAYKNDKYDVVIPQLEGSFLPFCGIYKKSLLPIFNQAFKQKHFKLKKIIMETNCKFLKLDKFEIELSNINSKHELALILNKYNKNKTKRS